MKEFYAIKLESGLYFPSSSGTAPALYTTPARAEAALKMRYRHYNKSYIIVKFSEVK